MTSLAVTIEAIDAALVDRYSGITILQEGLPIPVTVFIEKPNSEEQTERVFPSVTLMLVEINPKFEISETGDEDEEEVSYNTGVTPYERSMRVKPKPYELMYILDTWHKDRVSEARQLVQEVYMQRTDPRGYISVENIDGETIDLWAVTNGNLDSMQEDLPDTVIYHSSQVLAVEAYLSGVALPTDTTEEKVAMELQAKVFLRGSALGADGIEVESDDGTEDLTIRYTDTEEGPI